MRGGYCRDNEGHFPYFSDTATEEKIYRMSLAPEFIFRILLQLIR
jgi:hypothetical protein